VPPDGRLPDIAIVAGPPPLNARRGQGVRGLFDLQLLRFAMAGVLNSVFAFGVFAGLVFTLGARVHYLVLLLVAHVVGVLEAYVLQRWFVFRVTGRWWRELARFWSVYLVALATNVVALSLLVEVAHVAVLPAQAIVMLGTTLGTFAAHRAYTFRRIPTPPATTGTRRTSRT